MEAKESQYDSETAIPIKEMAFEAFDEGNFKDALDAFN
jgi:hypothetical protein